MDLPPAKRPKMASGKADKRRDEGQLRDVIEQLNDRIKELHKEIKHKEIKHNELEKTKAESPVMKEEIMKQITAIENQIAAKENQIAAMWNEIAAIRFEIAEILKERTGGPSSLYRVAKVPSSNNISSLASSSGSTVTNLYDNVPIFTHWFGVQMCRAYESAKEQVSKKAYPIKIELEKKEYEISGESLNTVIAATKMAATLRDDTTEYQSCRGLSGCPGLRTFEITFTSLYARALDRFLFPDAKAGACLHQFPCRERKSHPEVCDLYIAPFKPDFRLGDPLLLSDMKMDSLETVIKESILYSAAGVEGGTSKNFPVLIGIPAYTSCAELQLHVFVDKKVWILDIARAHPYDGALLCTLKAGVEHLINNNSLVQSTPLEFPTPFKEMLNYSTLGPRNLTFYNKDDNTVLKFYDRGIHLNENLNLDAMRRLVNQVEPLPGMKLIPDSDTSRLYELSYTYVENGDYPLTLKSFFGIVSTLSEMHKHNLVHGDIRFPNLVFGVEKSFLIDFDFVGENESDCYRPRYNSGLCERHKDALPNGKMMLIHDRYSLKYIIEQKVSELAKDAPILVELMDSQVSLDDLCQRHFADSYPV